MRKYNLYFYESPGTVKGLVVHCVLHTTDTVTIECGLKVVEVTQNIDLRL